MRYKFWFKVDIPDNKASDEVLQKLFQDVANAIQPVCSFDDEDWDFGVDHEWLSKISKEVIKCD